MDKENGITVKDDEAMNESDDSVTLLLQVLLAYTLLFRTYEYITYTFTCCSIDLLVMLFVIVDD